MRQYGSLVESAKHPTHNNIYSLVCFYEHATETETDF